MSPSVADLFPTRSAALANATRHACRWSPEFCRAPAPSPLSIRAYRIDAIKPIGPPGGRRSTLAFDRHAVYRSARLRIGRVLFGTRGRGSAVEQNQSIKFLAGIIKRAFRKNLMSPAADTRLTSAVFLPLWSQLPQQHGPPHRLRHRHRGDAAHNDRRNGRLVALIPIEKVSTQPQPMSDRQAIVLVLVLSLGLWALIWGLVIAIQGLLMSLF